MKICSITLLTKGKIKTTLLYKLAGIKMIDNMLCGEMGILLHGW